MRAAAFGLGLSIVWFGSAWAADWHYCYSAFYDQHRVYLSTPFSSAASGDELERIFERMLGEHDLAGGRAACPRAGSPDEIREQMQHATAYNRQSGTQVNQLTWSPADAISRR